MKQQQGIKLDFGRGVYLEVEGRSPRSEFHRTIEKIRPIIGTRDGHVLQLSCGHRVEAFGNLNHLDGLVLCTECRDYKRPQ